MVVGSDTSLEPNLNASGPISAGFNFNKYPVRTKKAGQGCQRDGRILSEPPLRLKDVPSPHDEGVGRQGEGEGRPRLSYCMHDPSPQPSPRAPFSRGAREPDGALRLYPECHREAVSSLTNINDERMEPGCMQSADATISRSAGAKPEAGSSLTRASLMEAEYRSGYRDAHPNGAGPWDSL